MKDSAGRAPATRARDAMSVLAPITYVVSFPEPHTHYADVRATVPAQGQPFVDVMMAVWTPGSYLVREFARHVEAVSASSPEGAPLSIDKTHKNRWRITTAGAAAVTVAYRVYGREMSVRTNWIESGFALINGAATFMTLADAAPRPHQVTLLPAAGWTRSMTGLTAVDDAAHRYVAPDFDTLVDSPIVLGNPTVYEFSVDGRPHFLVNEGEGGVFDGARAARDLETIVGEYRRMWGELPYDRYLFLNLITESGGGLEHGNSTVLMTSRWTTRTRRSYLDWLELASHEFFHTWNVKRLRPVELGPFDYENEGYTRSLWVAEGFTDYYGDLVLHRAGLSTREEYLDSLSSRIEELETTPGRHVRSAELASFDAWIKHYRPDENSANTTISYYTKGAVLAFLLDAHIRRGSGGVRSLDTVMRTAFRDYAGMRGYSPDDIRGVIEQVSGSNLATFWANAVHGTAELNYDDALETFGLRFGRRQEMTPRRPWLGIAARNDGGRLVVAQVRRDAPGFHAGINVDDEILAIDGFRVRADRYEHRLEQYAAGDRLMMLLARRDRLVEVSLITAAEPAPAWRLDVSPHATAEQTARLKQWLGPLPGPR